MKSGGRVIPYRRIVAATDLSDCSALAVTWAKAIAGAFGSELTLLHANVIQPLIEGVPANLAYTADYQMEGARTALDQFAAKHFGDDPSVRKIVVTGAAPDTILSAAYTIGADLIVIGTRGATGIRRVLLGSVAEAIIRRADRPVLAIRCDMPEPKTGRPAFRRILCPVQLSDRSIVPFAHARTLASTFGAELFVVHVGEETEGMFAVDTEAERLRTWIGTMPPGVRLTLLVHRGNPADEVLAYAKQHDIDLLVIGARPKSTGPQTVLGSTTEALTRHAPCPVLTVPTGNGES